MRMQMPVVVIGLLTGVAAAAVYAQITPTRFRRRSRNAAWRSRSGTSCACPTRAACVPPIRTCRRRAGRASATCATFPTAAASPTTRAASSTCSTRNNQPHVYANVGAAFPLAVYNRLESGFIGFTFHPEFARNGLFYTVHAERAPGNPEDARLHPARLHAEGRDLPQHHHGVARDQSRPPTCSRARGASCFARLTSSPTSRTRWARSSSTRRRSRATPTTACSTPAAAITGSATAADRTRTTRARRSGSTRS